MSSTSFPTAPPRERSRSCLLPWVLLALLVVVAGMAIWWGYNRPQDLAQYAVSSLLEQEIARMLPENVDATRTAVRVAAVLRAIQEGRFDAERLQGGGDMFREYYRDRQLDDIEFESLLAFAEAAVTR